MKATHTNLCCTSYPRKLLGEEWSESEAENQPKVEDDPQDELAPLIEQNTAKLFRVNLEMNEHHNVSDVFSPTRPSVGV